MKVKVIFDALDYLKIVLIILVDKELIIYIGIVFCCAFLFVFRLVFMSYI